MSRVDQLHNQYQALLGPICCSPPPQAVYSRSNYILVFVRLHPSAAMARLNLLYQFDDAGLALSLHLPMILHQNEGILQWAQPSLKYRQLLVYQIRVSTILEKKAERKHGLDYYPVAVKLRINSLIECKSEHWSMLSVYDGPFQFNPVLYSSCGIAGCTQTDNSTTEVISSTHQIYITAASNFFIPYRISFYSILQRLEYPPMEDFSSNISRSLVTWPHRFLSIVVSQYPRYTDMVCTYGGYKLVHKQHPYCQLWSIKTYKRAIKKFPILLPTSYDIQFQQAI